MDDILSLISYIGVATVVWHTVCRALCCGRRARNLEYKQHAVLLVISWVWAISCIFFGSTNNLFAWNISDKQQNIMLLSFMGFMYLHRDQVKTKIDKIEAGIEMDGIQSPLRLLHTALFYALPLTAVTCHRLSLIYTPDGLPAVQYFMFFILLPPLLHSVTAIWSRLNRYYYLDVGLMLFLFLYTTGVTVLYVVYNAISIWEHTPDSIFMRGLWFTQMLVLHGLALFMCVMTCKLTVLYTVIETKKDMKRLELMTVLESIGDTDMKSITSYTQFESDQENVVLENTYSENTQVD